MNVRKEIIEELYSPARRNYPRRKVVILGFDGCWQLDLVDLKKYKNENKNYTFILTVVDNFSKMVWAVPLKRKTGLEVTAAFQSILDKGRIPRSVQFDQGLEFLNSHFKTLLNHYKIHYYWTFSGLKASIVERWNKTLKTRMFKQFVLNGNHHWINILDDLVQDYNFSKHRGAPASIARGNAHEIKEKFEYKNLRNPKPPKFAVGDSVRIAKYRSIFSKGYEQNFSCDLFTIYDVKHTVPYSYLLQDSKNQRIVGTFLEWELKKTSHPGVYLIEKILNRKNGKMLIKWLSFPSSENSWVIDDADNVYV